MKRFYRVCV